MDKRIRSLFNVFRLALGWAFGAGASQTAGHLELNFPLTLLSALVFYGAVWFLLELAYTRSSDGRKRIIIFIPLALTLLAIVGVRLMESL